MANDSECDLPLLSHADEMTHPRDGHCPACKGGFNSGFAYLSAGALLLTEDEQDSIPTDLLRGFLHLGFHGVDPEMTDSSDTMVVDELHGGQFDLNWCSVRCLREWWNALFDRIERERAREQHDSNP